MMENLQEYNALGKAGQSSPDFSELMTLFDVSTLKLEQCANHTPSDDEGLDAKIEQTEIKYLALQQQVIEAALKTPLETPTDITNLLSLWLKEQASYGNDIRQSDALILRLCEHYNLG